MSVFQKLYQIEYLVKKAIETESGKKKQELLLQMGSLLGVRLPQVEAFNQNLNRQGY